MRIYMDIGTAKVFLNVQLVICFLSQIKKSHDISKSRIWSSFLLIKTSGSVVMLTVLLPANTHQRTVLVQCVLDQFNCGDFLIIEEQKLAHHHVLRTAIEYAKTFDIFFIYSATAAFTFHQFLLFFGLCPFCSICGNPFIVSTAQ